MFIFSVIVFIFRFIIYCKNQLFFAIFFFVKFHIVRLVECAMFLLIKYYSSTKGTFLIADIALRTSIRPTKLPQQLKTCPHNFQFLQLNFSDFKRMFDLVTNRDFNVTITEHP